MEANRKQKTVFLSISGATERITTQFIIQGVFLMYYIENDILMSEPF